MSDVRLKIGVTDRGGTAFMHPKAALEDAAAAVEVRLTPLSVGAIDATAAFEPQARETVVRAAANLKTAEVDAPIRGAAGAVIRGLLAPAFPTGLPSDGRLSIESDQSWVLSHIPWELGLWSGGPDLGPAILRRVSGVHEEALLDGRPIAMVAMAQVRDALVAIRSPRDFVPGIGETLRAAPPIVVADEIGGGLNEFLTYEALRTSLRQVEPDILVLIAHGSAEPEATLFFESAGGDGLVPKKVANLMTDLDGARKPLLGIFLCCDLNQGKIFDVSAGVAMVRGGLAEVVAMQGQLDQAAASTFVKDLLFRLQKLDGVVEAVHGARGAIAVNDSWQAMLPCLYAASDSAASTRRWSAVRQAFRTALRALTVPPVRTFRWSQSFARREEILALCRGRGALLITGPPDPESFSLTAPFADVVARQASDVVAGSRPILMIPCEADPNRVGSEGAWRDIFDRLEILLEQAAGVRPSIAAPPIFDADEPKRAAEQVVRAVEKMQATLVMLTPEPPESETTPDGLFWTVLGAGARHPSMNAGIIVVPSAGDLNAFASYLGEGVPIAAIRPLDRDEIDEIMAQRREDFQVAHPQLRGAQLSVLTAGNPYLVDLSLDLVASRYEGDVSELLRDAANSVTATSVHILLALSSEADRLGYLALALMRGPATFEALRLAFFAHGPEALSAGIGRGTLIRKPLAQGNGTWDYLMPKALAEALRQEIDARYPDAMVDAAWAVRDALVVGDAVEKVAREAGGPSVIEAAQALCIEAWRKTDATDLLNWAGMLAVQLREFDSDNNPLRPRRPLITVYERSFKLAGEAGHAFPDAALWAAYTAKAEGAAVEARSILSRDLADDSQLPFEVRLEAAVLRAEIAKDIEQHESAVASVHAISTAIDEATAALETFEDPSTLGKIIADAKYVRLKIELFLRHKSHEELAPIVQDLLVDDRESLRVFGALIESELKDRKPDWDAIARWRAQAERHLLDREVEALADPRDAAYCYYQIAQSLRRGPASDFALAESYYRTSAEVAGGLEPERRALALSRLLQMMEARSAPKAEIGRQRAHLSEALETVVRGDMRAAVQSSWSARVLVLGHLHLGKTASDVTEARDHYRTAIRAALSPKLTRESDGLQLASAVIRFLSIAPTEGRAFLRVRSLLRDLIPVLRDRLTLDISLVEAPELQKLLSVWLQERGEDLI